MGFSTIYFTPNNSVVVVGFNSNDADFNFMELDKIIHCYPVSVTQSRLIHKLLLRRFHFENINHASVCHGSMVWINFRVKLSKRAFPPCHIALSGTHNLSGRGGINSELLGKISALSPVAIRRLSRDLSRKRHPIGLFAKATTVYLKATYADMLPQQ